MDYIVMGFGAVLVLVGIVLFIKGVKESESGVRMFNISFNITNPAILIFVIGCVIFMAPYVFQGMRESAKFDVDKKATGEQTKLADEESKKAKKERLEIEEEKRLEIEENRKKTKDLEKAIEAERDKLYQEARRAEEAKRAKEQELSRLSGEERAAKEEELAMLQRDAEEKTEKARLAEEIVKAERDKRQKEEEIARLQEEARRKREEAEVAAGETERIRLEEEARRAQEEKLAKENELNRLKTSFERNIEIAKGDKKLVFLNRQMERMEPISPINLELPETERECHQINIGDNFGDRNTFDIKVTKPGPIKIKVDWQGPELALILNGPGQTGYYARKDGPCPLAITYDVAKTVLNRGTQWKVSVVNFSKKGQATGKIVIEYPE